ncbi:MAG: DNA polymerase III subunit beta [Ruminococcus sp.]|nr:DNA polymerase III subunit beta [Ruminococcus sp.]
MKINVLRTDLANAVSIVSRAVSNKASIPALEGLLIKAYGSKITISGYDLEIGINTSIDATISAQGEIVVSAKLFSEIVRKLPEEVVCIETDDRMITYITSGHADYQIVGMNSAEYPDLPEFEETEGFEIEGNVLKEMIRQTVYAVSDNNAKPIYTGSLFEIENKSFKIVAVDGYRMAIRQEAVDCDENTQFVVPGKTQQEVLKIVGNDEENVYVSVGQRHIMFKIGSYSVISRLIEGTFLDYNSTIPKTQKTEATVNTRLLINAVDRMSLLNGDKIQSPVRCNFVNGEIHFSCTSAIGKANDVISAPINGDDVEIGFNNRYLLDALRNIDADEVKITLNGGLSPMIIKPVQGDSFISLVVPMRLSNE